MSVVDITRQLGLNKIRPKIKGSYDVWYSMDHCHDYWYVRVNKSCTYLCKDGTLTHLEIHNHFRETFNTDQKYYYASREEAISYAKKYIDGKMISCD